MVAAGSATVVTEIQSTMRMLVEPRKVDTCTEMLLICETIPARKANGRRCSRQLSGRTPISSNRGMVPVT